MENLSENTDTIKKKKIGKGNARDTLYRITLQNQMQSIAIVDQKANIIIGINTILISIIMATVGMKTSFVQFDFSGNISLSLPFTVLLIFCVASGIVSILVVRPTRRLWFRENPSRLFFKNYRECSLEQFKLEMKGIINDNEQIYDVLDNDLYLNGLTIQRKYRLVRFAYILFMAGLVLAVSVFLILQIFLSNF